MTILVTGRLNVSEAQHRNQTALMLASDGTQLGVVETVHSGLTLSKTSGLGWSLDLGRCTIAPATAANGPVVATVTVAETGSFAPGDATRNRIDVVALQIDETATVANGNPPVYVTVIQGAYPVSGSPVRPTIPAGAIGLWAEQINAGTSSATGWDTSLLTDIRPSMPSIRQGRAVAGRTPYEDMGTQVIATNSSGDSAVVFPTAFPNGLLWASLQDATPTGSLGHIRVKVTFALSDRTRVTCRLYDSTGNALVNLANVTLLWRAIGY